jgi:hypothetical protein
MRADALLPVVPKARFQRDGRRCPVEPKARLRRDGADEGAFSTKSPLTLFAE